MRACAEVMNNRTWMYDMYLPDLGGIKPEYFKGWMSLSNLLLLKNITWMEIRLMSLLIKK